MINNYLYQARNIKGDLFKGNICADNLQEAAEVLQQNGLYVIALKKDYFRYFSQFFNNSLDTRELVLVCHQLSIMLQAGVPLGNAVKIIYQARLGHNEKEEDKITESLKNIYLALQQGSCFSEALEATSNMFSPVMIAAIKAGEAGGMLDEVLRRETKAIDHAYRTKLKLKNALVYPSFLICSAVVLVAVIFIFVLPVFCELFKSMNTVLPWPTRFILGINDFLVNNIMVIIFLLGASVILGIYLWQNKNIRLNTYKVMLKIPIWGNLLRKIELQRWLETMSLLLSAGVVLTEAIKISSNVVSNAYLKFCIDGFKDSVRRGSNLSEAGYSSGCLDNFIIELVKAGEVSGEMPEMLAEAGTLCKIEADTIIKRLETMLEPTIIIFLAIITGFLVISILMPMMEMMTMYSA